jgi:hypothetical protein
MTEKDVLKRNGRNQKSGIFSGSILLHFLNQFFWLSTLSFFAAKTLALPASARKAVGSNDICALKWHFMETALIEISFL